MLIEPGQVESRVPEGESQIVVLARDAFAKRWAEMADDVVAKNMLSSLELAMPGIAGRLTTTLLGRVSAPFFAVGSYPISTGPYPPAPSTYAIPKGRTWTTSFTV